VAMQNTDFFDIVSPILLSLLFFYRYTGWLFFSWFRARGISPPSLRYGAAIP